MRMSGHTTRAVFERYNVVDESDLRNAAGTLDQLGRVLDRVAEEAPEKCQSPAESLSAGLRVFGVTGARSERQSRPAVSLVADIARARGSSDPEKFVTVRQPRLAA